MMRRTASNAMPKTMPKTMIAAMPKTMPERMIATMTRVVTVALGCCALVVMMTSAHADDTRLIEATGEASADSESARVRAIDTALAEAVGQVIIDELAPGVRKRHRKTLNTEVVRRARRFVAGFKVLEEGETEGRYRVRIEARVDVATMRRQLETLGIGDNDDVVTSQPRPVIALLVHETVGEHTGATFGANADRDGAASRTVAERLTEQGFALASAAGQKIPISRELPQGVPLSDDAAAELARTRGAGGALVMGVRAWRDGSIRGTQLAGAVARATVRVLDVDAGGVSLVARVDVESAGFGASEREALDNAAARVAELAMSTIALSLVGYWPPLVAATDDAMLVEVRGFADWSMIDALMAGLADTPGIERVWPRQLGNRGVVLAVSTRLSQRRVSAAIERTRVPAVSLRVSPLGATGLQVEIRGEDGP